MEQVEAKEIFEKTKAMLNGHFKLTSGRHSNQYFQCALVLQHPQHCEKLCKSLAQKFSQEKIDVVVGPAMGGIIVAYEVARALGVRSIFTERENGKMTLRRGFSLQEGEKVLVVEDVITTGGSVAEVIDLVTKQKAEVVGVGVLVNRSGGKADFGLPLKAMLEVEAISYDPEECPLCKEEKIPAIKPGSRNL